MKFSIKLFLVIILCCFLTTCLSARDSTRSLYLMLGSYNYGFNNEAYSFTGSSFFYNTVSPLTNPSIGCKSNIYFSERKNIGFSLLYSYANIGYHYSYRQIPYGRSEYDGNISMQCLILNSLLQYRVLKWMKVNYGLSQHFNFSSSFDNDQIAKDIGWNNANDKRRIKHYTAAFSYGLEFKLYKKLSLEINSMRGLNNFAVLSFKDDPKGINPLRLIYTGVTFNYKI